MIKNEFIELVTGLGNAEVYFAIPGNGANIGKFWDFAGLTWVTPITAACKVFATEYNSDGTVSVYRADITLPTSGGPFIIYCYLASTGKLQGQDFTAVDEIDAAIANRPTLADIEASTAIAKQAKLDTLHDTRIPGVIQPQTGDSFARLGAPAGASVSADVAVVAGYVDTEIQTIVDALGNATYGLSALKTLIDAIDTSTELAARFTEIKGAGWTTQTLKALGDLLDALPTAASIAASTSSLILASTLAKGVIQSSVTVTSNATQKVVRGDEKLLTFNLGSAWNLTGKKAYFVMKNYATDANDDAIVNRECAIVTAASGICNITLTATETATIGEYFAEVEVRDTDETSPGTALQFKLIIEQDGRQ